MTKDINGKPPLPKNPIRKTIAVKDIRQDLWQSFLALNKFRGMNAKQALEELIHEYLRKSGKMDFTVEK